MWKQIGFIKGILLLGIVSVLTLAYCQFEDTFPTHASISNEATSQDTRAWGLWQSVPAHAQPPSQVAVGRE